MKLRENVGWVVGCRVGGGYVVKFMEKHVKEGKCRVGGGVCVTNQRKK